MGGLYAAPRCPSNTLRDKIASKAAAAYGQSRRLGLKRAHRFRPSLSGRRAMRIAIASDHAAWELKAALADWLRDAGHEVADLGTNGPESVDYPDYGYALAEAVANGRAERGVALCGSGIGISI